MLEAAISLWCTHYFSRLPSPPQLPCVALIPGSCWGSSCSSPACLFPIDAKGTSSRRAWAMPCPCTWLARGARACPECCPSGQEGSGVSVLLLLGEVTVVILFCSASWLCLAPSQFQRARGSFWEVLALVVFWFVWFLSEFGGFFCCCFSLDFCSLCFGCSHLFILILSFLEQ